MGEGETGPTRPATTLREAYQATDPRPLPSGDPYFVDLAQARGSPATDHLRLMIEDCGPNQYAAIAFTGHRGSGKSTELLQLKHALRSSCFGLYLGTAEYLDVADIEYTDLFLLVSRRLLDALQEAGVNLSAKLLKNVESWFVDVTKETEETVRLSAGISAEAKAGVEIPFIAKLLAKLTADLKAGSSRKVTTRQELDHYFSGLVANTNALLTAAAKALDEAGRPSQILVLFDGLDKIPPEKSDRLFFLHGSQLQDLACHVVYTTSIDTYYSRQRISTVFPQNVILPNVKLREEKFSSKPNPAGIDAMSEMVRRRMDVDGLFKPRALAEVVVGLSGGSVRQLILLLREGILSAQSRNLSAVDEGAIQEAARKLQHTFERILTPEDYELLARTSASKRIEKSPPYMGLLYNSAVLEYNTKDLWHDVNPLIEPIDAFQRASKRARREASRKKRSHAGRGGRGV